MGSRDLGADEAFARAEEMVRACMAEQGGERIEFEINAVGETELLSGWLIRGGEREGVFLSDNIFSSLRNMRKAQFIRGRGAWTWSRLWMDASDGVLHQECDWTRVPMLDDNTPSLVACKEEMQLFPRDGEFLPDWLREGADRWRTEVVPMAADEEAERAAREVEFARLVDVSRRRAAAEIEAAWNRAVEGLLGGGVLRLPSGTVDGVVPVSEGVGLVRAWAGLGPLVASDVAFGLCERLGWVCKECFDGEGRYWTAAGQGGASAWMQVSETKGLFHLVKIALSEFRHRACRGDPAYKEYKKALHDLYGEPVGREVWLIDNDVEVALLVGAARLQIRVEMLVDLGFYGDEDEDEGDEDDIGVDFDDPTLYIRAPSEVRSEVVLVDGDVLEWS